MKKIRGVFSFIVLFLLFSITSAFAFENNNLQQNDSNLVDTVLKLNDPNWNELLKNSDVSHKQIKEEYFKVIENENHENSIRYKKFTPEQYRAKKSKHLRYIVDQPEKWLKIRYEIMPILDKKTFSVLAGFTWIGQPHMQQEDMFIVSSDSNSVLPGSNSRVNFSYFPNKTYRGVSTTWNSQSQRNKFIFKNGAVGVKFNIVPSECHSSAYKYPDGFGFGHSITTSGSPDGILGFTCRFSGNNDATNLGFSYFHKQINLGTPSISISSGGSISLSGIASSGYDSAKTSARYLKGTMLDN